MTTTPTTLLRTALALFLAAAMWACGSSDHATGRAVITVSVAEPRYSVAELEPVGSDSPAAGGFEVVGGSVTIERTDTALMPYMAFLRLYNPDDSIDFIELPVMVEAGEPTVTVGEYVTVGGTPLNERVNSFLSARAAMGRELHSRDSLSIDGLTEAYSHFYASQIVANAATPLGRGLMEAYGHHLSPDDRSAALKALDAH